MLKLSLSIPAGDRETPASFASRLARRNFVSARDLAKDFGLSFQKIVDGDANEIRRLADLAGASVKDLLANAIRKIGTAFEFRGQNISKVGLRRARVHVCPHCIQEDIGSSELPADLAAYGRFDWTIGSIRSCAKHSVPLVEVARDLQPGHYHDFSRNIAAAIPAMDRLAQEAPRRPASGLETYLAARIEGRADHPWLDSLPFSAAAWTTEVVGAVAEFGKRVNLDLLGEDQMYRAGATGFEITKAGAAGIDDFMARLKREHVPKKEGSADGPQATYGKLFMCFAQGLPDPAYDLVRATLGDHILANFPLGPGDELFGKPVEIRRFHSIRSASKHYGMHPKRLRKLIEVEGLVADRSVKDRDVLFDAGVADRLFKREADSLTLTQVEKYLNAPRPLPKYFLEAGLIRRHSVGSDALHEVFFKSELDQFLTTLFHKAETVTHARPDAHEIRTVAHRANCSVVEILRLIIDGRLAWIGRLAGVHGLAAILVDLDEVKSMTTLPDLGGLIPANALRALRVNCKVMTGLLRVGAFKTVVQRHPIKRNPQVVIPFEEIERFKSEYVSLFTAARSQGKHMPVLLRELRALGVQPVPQFKGVGATFFKRADVPS
jgi:TniQ